MPEGQRGPLSTRWAAKPLGGVNFVAKSRQRKIAMSEPLSQCCALPAPLSGEPYFPYLFVMEIPVENIPPECFQNQSTANGTQGGAVLFAPPSKSCRFSHPPSPCAQKYGHGDFAVCGRRLRGHVPSKNTSPTVLSWISLTGSTTPFFFVPARCFLMNTVCHFYRE